MIEIYWDLNIGEWEFENNYEDIYFLLHCLYNAKTELYDRTLTDMRSRYDPTEAFIEGWNRSRSNWYSKKLYAEAFLKKFDTEWKRYNRDLIIKVRKYEQEHSGEEE